ncbi:tetratricopeptide repeat protein [Solihabitans fulvus]|uniref:Tetratricopeptide repeat protein n=1 Tax=Solihabitans fulvus TaxID=1892852 RepID=A0A5B2WQZ3_9PSEU|nr:BTAD domain-containing putative transcriptional regulator [Solihabitans fulvus]KAA2254423.1 tetratricopeptide repeat protein [Solihabitans fulvus]
MEFRILGPIEARGSAGQARLAGRKQVALLAALLLRDNQVVPVERLFEALWGDAPPNAAAAALQTYVFRLRQCLEAVEPGAGRRLTFSSGYRLAVEPMELDLAAFRTHAGRGRAAAAAGESEVAAKEFHTALNLWRGTALPGLPGRYFEAHAARLTEEHLAALEERIDADLAMGRQLEVIPELRSLVAAHRLRGQLHGRLMVALYRAGRQAEAIGAFHDASAVFVEELGIDPDPALVELHQRILANDPDLAAPGEAGRPATRNDLPGDIADFTGREAEVQRLVAALPDGDAAGSAVVIEAIDGMAGVGKTTLAVHTAHHLVDRYPDAQLFIDLHGHSTGQRATDPATALDVLLRALGVPGERIPTGLDQRAALWRAELAGRRVLVVLDNAEGAAQVRPLLPGNPACLALITSRRRLADLDAARILSLDVLPLPDAEALFARIAGRPSAAEPEAVREVVELCGRLPLAIRIAAARLRTRPAWTAAHLARRLREGQRRLTELATGDRSVAAAFALSYQHLSGEHQRMFRLLGLHPGPDFDVYAAASLAGASLAEADRLVEELVDIHLLQQSIRGRYRFHDLLRHHAGDTARAVESEARQQEALRRLVDCYLHTLHAGDRLLYPQRPPVEFGDRVDGCLTRPLGDQTEALAWYDAEHPCLFAVRQLAVRLGWHERVWQLAWALDNFHRWRGHLDDQLAGWRAGLAAALLVGGQDIQALAHRRLGDTCARVGEHAEGVHHLRRALALAEQADDTQNRAHGHYTLAQALERQGDDRQALDHATRALALYEGLGNVMWEAVALNAVGWYHARLDDAERARDFCERALVLFRQGAQRAGEAGTLDSLGYIAHHAGRLDEAVGHYRAAVALYRDLGDTFVEANTLVGLGRTHAGLGQREEAGEAWRRAFDIYRDQHRAEDAERVRRLLDSLGP